MRQTTDTPHIRLF